MQTRAFWFRVRALDAFARVTAAPAPRCEPSRLHLRRPHASVFSSTPSHLRTMTAVADGPFPDSDLQDPADRRQKRHPKNNATTGASAAGIRALSVQFMTFYFRAPIKAFFRSRIEYVRCHPPVRSR